MRDRDFVEEWEFGVGRVLTGIGKIQYGVRLKM